MIVLTWHYPEGYLAHYVNYTYGSFPDDGMLYASGMAAPNYPVPAVCRVNPLIEYYILRDIFNFFWGKL